MFKFFDRGFQYYYYVRYSCCGFSSNKFIGTYLDFFPSSISFISFHSFVSIRRIERSAIAFTNSERKIALRSEQTNTHVCAILRTELVKATETALNYLYSIRHWFHSFHFVHSQPKCRLHYFYCEYLFTRLLLACTVKIIQHESIQFNQNESPLHV